MIKHYIKIALRQLLKYKAQYLISVIGIAVGMICFSLTNYFIRRATSQFTVWPNSSQIAKISLKQKDSDKETFYFPGKELQMLMNNPVAGIDKITWAEAKYNENITFRKENESEAPFLCDVLYITDDFIPIYLLESIDGKEPLLHHGGVLISESMASKVYGNENPVGKVLYTSRSDMDTTTVTYATISGVIKDLPDGTKEKKDLYFPVTESINPDRNYWALTSILIQKGISVKTINKRLLLQFPTIGENEGEFLVIDIFKNLVLRSSEYMGVLLFGIIGSLLLISAMINFLKLCIQSFYNRKREISLRKSLGAGQMSLFCLLFTEIIILLLIALGFTFVLTEIFIPFLFLYLPEMVSSSIYIDTSLLMKQQMQYLIILFIICAIICLLVISRVRRLNLIKEIRGGNLNKHYFRNAMLGFQIFICFLFVGGAVGMNMVHDLAAEIENKTLTDKEAERIWQIYMNQPQLLGHEEEIANEITMLPGVEDVLFQSAQSNLNYQTSRQEILSIQNTAVSGNYAEFMKLPIEGRMPSNMNEIVISRSLLWELEDERKDTKSILLGDKMYFITGIYEQLPFRPFLTKEQIKKIDKPYKYSVLTLSENIGRNMDVKCIPGHEKAVKKGILTIIRKRLPETIPFQLLTLHEYQTVHNGGGSLMIGDLFTLLSIISLIITVLGIYSAITLDSEKRQKEVAIRKINGADQRVIALLFGKLYIRLLIFTAIPALGIVYLSLYKLIIIEIPVFIKWLYNPFMWIFIIAIVGGIVFLTVGYRIKLMMKLNPADIIKNE